MAFILLIIIGFVGYQCKAYLNEEPSLLEVFLIYRVRRIYLKNKIEYSALKSSDILDALSLHSPTVHLQTNKDIFKENISDLSKAGELTFHIREHYRYNKLKSPWFVDYDLNKLTQETLGEISAVNRRGKELYSDLGISPEALVRLIAVQRKYNDVKYLK